MRDLLAVILTCLLWPAALGAQPADLLPDAAAVKLYEETSQLMESTAIVIPGLLRASAPVHENVKQTITLMRQQNLIRHAAMNYRLLKSLRAYLALADALPRPSSMPAEAERQMQQLKGNLEVLEKHFNALLEQREIALRNPDRDQFSRYQEGNSQLPPPQKNLPRVVFLGDSITDGWRLKEYFPDYDFVNRGIGGQVTSEMLGRMQPDVIALRPAALHILAGTNDIARGVPESIIRSNLSSIFDLADKHNIKLIVGAILPVHDARKGEDPRFDRTPFRPLATIRALNDWLRQECARRRYVFADYYTATADANGLLKADLADDGLHPNAMGYRVMAPVTMDAVRRALGISGRKGN